MPELNPQRSLESVRARKEQILDDMERIMPTLTRELRMVLAEEKILQEEQGVEKNNPFSAFKNAADAAEALLSSIEPYTLDRDETAEAAIAGGWGIGQPGRLLKMKIAIGMAINRGNKIIERHDGKLATLEQSKQL